MPRRSKPIDGNSNVQELAKQLLHVKESAGTNYREMAKKVPYSHAQLGRAAHGERLPNWPLMNAYLTACGVPETDRLQVWKPYWDALDLVAGRSASRGRTRELHRIQDTPEFGRYLHRMAKRDGPKSLRLLQEITGISKSTINDWFRGNTLPTAGHLHQFATTLGADEDLLRELLEVRDRLESEGNGGSELARTLATIRSTNRAGSVTATAVKQVSLALAEAESRRVKRVTPGPYTLVEPAPKIEKPATDRKAASRDTAAAYARQREQAAKVIDTLAPQTPARHGSRDLAARRAKARDLAAARLEELQAEAADAHKAAVDQLDYARMEYQSALSRENNYVLHGKHLIELEDAREYTAECAAAYRQAVVLEEQARERLESVADAAVPVPNLTRSDTLEALSRVLGSGTFADAFDRLETTDRSVKLTFTGGEDSTSIKIRPNRRHMEEQLVDPYPIAFLPDSDVLHVKIGGGDQQIAFNPADAVVPVVPVDYPEQSPFGEPLEMDNPVTQID